VPDEESSASDEDNSKIEQALDKMKVGADISAKAIAEAAKKAGETVSKLSTDIGTKIAEKKDIMVENRKKKKSEFIESLKGDEKYKQIIVDKEKLPRMVSLPVVEHKEMIETIQRLESEVRELENALQSASNNESEIPTKVDSDGDEIPPENAEVTNNTETERGLSGEVGISLNQILITLGFSVMWAIILIVINFQLEERGFELSGLGTKAVVWPIGTAIWAMFLLTSQKKAGTLLSMKLGNRIKTSIGVGLATTLSLMLTDGDMQGITNVWGWTMTAALCAFLLSGFIRGLVSSARNVSRVLSFSK
tara:strand:+ start:3018 stop:3938 length:921 start_codon:yes stop_codon:yes gene_type:complete